MALMTHAQAVEPVITQLQLPDWPLISKICVWTESSGGPLGKHKVGHRCGQRSKMTEFMQELRGSADRAYRVQQKGSQY